MKAGYLAALAAAGIVFISGGRADATPAAGSREYVLGVKTAAQGVINKKCTSCHSSARIEAALAAEKDMQKIQQEMEKKGAALNAKERDVLGIYWKESNPLKKGK